MTSRTGLHEITEAVSDATGLTPEQVWVWAAVTVSVATAAVALRTVDAVVRLFEAITRE